MVYDTRSVARAAGPRRQHRAPMNHTERRQLLQLAICLLLFLTVYVGRGILPEETTGIGSRLAAVLSADLDLRAAATQLGISLRDGKLKECIGGLCGTVFSSGEEGTVSTPTASAIPVPDVLSAELNYLSGSTRKDGRAEHYLGEQGAGYIQAELPSSSEQKEPAFAEEAAVPAAGTVLVYAEAAGTDLPRNCSLNQISLGQLEYVVPVNGALNSGYGYRNHPINGKYLFHTGVDIDGNRGDPIAAFASGTVEYVGEDSSYGLYFQLDHGNGVKSFYAHCDSLCVTKGQRVTLGDVVAYVGSTGTVTGPHLHFELKYERLRLDPSYYLEFVQSA